MRRILSHRKVLDVTERIELSDLKAVYRKPMKDWHPDKFSNNEEEKLAAEEKSKKIIESYHFLVSIAPETKALTMDAYMETTANGSIDDFEFKSEILTIRFSDGNTYEYYGVPKSIYVKLVNAETPARFARRHIYHNYVYRSTSKLVAAI